MIPNIRARIIPIVDIEVSASKSAGLSLYAKELQTAKLKSALVIRTFFHFPLNLFFAFSIAC